MKIKIKSVKKIRQSEIAEICQRVIENMANNPLYPTLPPEYDELKQALPGFLTSLGNARGRDKIMVSIKNDEKAKMQRLLTAIADYVTVTSNGDRTILLSSGFDITDENGYTTALAIETLVVEVVAPGEAITRAKNATAAVAYIHQYTTEPPGINTSWIGEGSSQGTYKFERLISDKRYWFRVVAIGRNGQRAYSPVVSGVIQ